MFSRFTKGEADRALQPFGLLSSTDLLHMSSTPGNGSSLPRASILQEKRTSASQDLLIICDRLGKVSLFFKNHKGRPQLPTQITTAHAPYLLTQNPSGPIP